MKNCEAFMVVVCASDRQLAAPPKPLMRVTE
jgi:hypothetical protein